MMDFLAAAAAAHFWHIWHRTFVFVFVVVESTTLYIVYIYVYVYNEKYIYRNVCVVEGLFRPEKGARA